MSLHARWTAWRNLARLEGGRSMFRIQIDHLIPGIFYLVHVWTHSWPGQSMASTSCWSRNATMSSATCGEALYSLIQSSDRASLSPMVAYGPPESGCIDACALSYPGWPGYSSHAWWIAPRTITDGLRFPWVSSWMQASISLSPCLWHTRALPSLWYGRTWTDHWKCSVSSDAGPRQRLLWSHSRQRQNSESSASPGKEQKWNGPSWPYEVSRFHGA